MAMMLELIGHTEDSLVACDNMSMCPTLKITFFEAKLHLQDPVECLQQNVDESCSWYKCINVQYTLCLKKRPNFKTV